MPTILFIRKGRLRDWHHLADEMFRHRTEWRFE